MQIVNGIILDGVMRGWNARNDNKNAVPFDLHSYLSKGSADFTLPDGEYNNVTFSRNDDMFLFSSGKKLIKLYREWKNENQNMVRWLESVAIGECTRKVIEGKKILD